MPADDSQELFFRKPLGHFVEDPATLVLVQVDQCDVISWRSHVLVCPYRWVEDHRAIDYVVELRPDPFRVKYGQVRLKSQEFLVWQEVVVHDKHKRDTQGVGNSGCPLSIIVVRHNHIRLPGLDLLTSIHHIGHVDRHSLILVKGRSLRKDGCPHNNLMSCLNKSLTHRMEHGFRTGIAIWYVEVRENCHAHWRSLKRKAEGGAYPAHLIHGSVKPSYGLATRWVDDLYKRIKVVDNPTEGALNKQRNLVSLPH